MRLPSGLAALAHCFARFIGVGLVGLSVDSGLFGLDCAVGLSPAAARALSLFAATAVTWALDRAYTFGPSPRCRAMESARYVLVAVLAQAQNYVVFLGLTAAFPNHTPLFWVLAGAAWATGFSFAGQLLFTFAPGRAHTLGRYAKAIRSSQSRPSQGDRKVKCA